MKGLSELSEYRTIRVNSNGLVSLNYDDRPTTYSPKEAIAYYKKHIYDSPLFDPTIEHMAVIMIDAQAHIIGHYISAKGQANMVGAVAPEIFRTAIVQGAYAIVLVHNHPLGSGPRPSDADIAFYAGMRLAGGMLRVQVKDSLVYGEKNSEFPSGWASAHREGESRYRKWNNPVDDFKFISGMISQEILPLD